MTKWFTFILWFSHWSLKPPSCCFYLGRKVSLGFAPVRESTSTTNNHVITLPTIKMSFVKPFLLVKFNNFRFLLISISGLIP